MYVRNSVDSSQRGPICMLINISKIAVDTMSVLTLVLYLTVFEYFLCGFVVIINSMIPYYLTTIIVSDTSEANVLNMWPTYSTA